MDDTLPIMTIQQIGHLIAGDIPGSQRNGLGRHPIPEVVGYISNSNLPVYQHTCVGGGAFTRPGMRHRNDPFSSPHVQRATGKTRSHETFSSSNSSSSSSWYGSSESSFGFSSGYNRRSAAGRRAEEKNAREVDAQMNSGLWNALPTIGVTLLFLMFAHGHGAKA